MPEPATQPVGCRSSGDAESPTAKWLGKPGGGAPAECPVVVVVVLDGGGGEDGGGVHAAAIATTAASTAVTPKRRATPARRAPVLMTSWPRVHAGVGARTKRSRARSSSQ